MSKVLIPLAQGCEEIEAVTMIDLLRRGQISVTTAGLETQLSPVKAARGTQLLPDTTLDEALQDDYDMIALPGGLPGADNLNDDERIIQLVQKMAAADKYICAICAAPRVLARAGVLEGKRATSYPGTLDTMDIAGMTYTGAAVTVDGRIITGRGPGPAMDFALALIEALGGTALKHSVEQPLLRD
ncbi:4-methyl-5(B-hydroxyethyl)-thiazole monophosphate biosynthesis protein [Candidatus Tenderia electrophaga]|jgi:4-methyl-5(b-hydroxyethyl)-thiazole monophosphate biosynthesis|uniref:4-methyl-5(B-hydroxyethyl)-thiazole monophosphate biosynthesis protein n=1 Tax=Candidatus Tenderia electrophaga TaxID=1748243 RepID=A0A0S2THG8_9GAMM|nr:4-methyl-5(B-hydroxyethyl)-thiazole monophosphate biosynthesis protein [Candidatus Tenderia electrophaga]